MNRYFTSLVTSVWLLSALGGQPTDNPVAASGIDLGTYDASWVEDMVDWSQVTTTAAVPNDGAYDAMGAITAGDDLAVVQAEIFQLSAAGGGVLYFPPGTYDFSGKLYLADGVVLRGATPESKDCRGTYAESGGVRTYTMIYDPPTNFHFPVYQHALSNNMRPSTSGGDGSREKFFKTIEVGKSDGAGGVLPDATDANNYGLVNIDIDGAAISIGDRDANDQTWGTTIPKNKVSGRYILIFGNRLNNAFLPEPSIPRASQNAWQIWPTRTRGKIDVVSGGYTLIANNVVSDLHYRRFVRQETVATIDHQIHIDTAGKPNSELYLDSTGKKITVNSGDTDWVYSTDGYGIRLNHVLDYVTAHTAVQEPSKHRLGQGIVNNWVFATTRVGLMGAGNGLVVHNNVRVDFLPSQTKWEFIKEDGTGKQTNNSATQENRGIDLTGGHDVVATGNYVQVRRGNWDGGNYLTIDGEGLLLQESSSTVHPTNWLIKDNILHSYIGIYRVVYSNSIHFENNIVYGGDPLYTDGARNGAQGRTGGRVSFKNNTASSIYSKYNIKPRNYQLIDLGGNQPAPINKQEGNGGIGAGAALVDAVPELVILQPTLADFRSGAVKEGDTITVRVQVTRDPADATPVQGVKIWDGVTNYPVKGKIAENEDYWNYDNTTPGKPAGVALNLTTPDAVTGAIGGGIYTGNWTVPVGFLEYGLLVAEIRLENQTGATGAWTERNWAFLQAGEASGTAPTIVTPPQSQTVTVGGTVTFTVTAEGTAPLSYQWQKNDQVLEQADTDTLTINDVQLSDAGSYTVVVTNDFGSVTSAAAVLSVIPPAFSGGSLDVDNLATGNITGQAGWTYTQDNSSQMPVEGAAVAEGALKITLDDGAVVDGGAKHIYLQARSGAYGKMDRWMVYAPVEFGRTVYFRFLAQMESHTNVESGLAYDPYEIFFGLDDSSSSSAAPWDAYVAVRIPQNGQAAGLETTGSGGLVLVDGLAVGEPMLVVGCFEVNQEGLLSRVQLWINPTRAEQASPLVDAVIASPTTMLAQQSFLKIRAQNMPARLDALAFAENWNDLVPETTVRTVRFTTVPALSASVQFEGIEDTVLQPGETPHQPGEEPPTIATIPRAVFQAALDEAVAENRGGVINFDPAKAVVVNGPAWPGDGKYENIFKMEAVLGAQLVPIRKGPQNYVQGDCSAGYLGRECSTVSFIQNSPPQNQTTAFRNWSINNTLGGSNSYHLQFERDSRITMAGFVYINWNNFQSHRATKPYPNKPNVRVHAWFSNGTQTRELISTGYTEQTAEPYNTWFAFAAPEVGYYLTDIVFWAVGNNARIWASMDDLALITEDTEMYTFTFNNEGKVGGLDRTMQDAHWNGVYGPTAQPLVTSDAVYANLSEGVTDDTTPGHYKAGFLYVSGRTGQPAPGGFLVYSENLKVVNEPQVPLVQNPQTDWYAPAGASSRDLRAFPLSHLREVTFRTRPRNPTNKDFRVALQLEDGKWYLSQQSFTQQTTNWEYKTLPVLGSGWYTDVVGAGFLNLDFATQAPTVVTYEAMPLNAKIKSMGLYFDTNDNDGEQASWVRVDSIALSLVSLPPPEFTVTPLVHFLSSEESQFSVSVSTSPPGTDWTAITNDTWITVLSGASGSGDGSVLAVAAPNDSINDRIGSLLVAGQTVTVHQAGATPRYEIFPTSQAVAANGGSFAVTVAAMPADAPWSALADQDWLTVTSGAAGVGQGTVGYTVAANKSVMSRVGTLTVAGITLTVNQDGQTPLISIDPSSVAIGSFAFMGTVAVNASPSDAAWTAVSNVAWINVTSGASGTGQGLVAYTVEANLAYHRRTGTITIGDRVFTLVQDRTYTKPWSDATVDFGNGFRWNSLLSYVYDGYYPFVFIYDLGDWIWIAPEGAEETTGYYFWNYAWEHWGFSAAEFYPLYAVLSGEQSGQWIPLLKKR